MLPKLIFFFAPKLKLTFINESEFFNSIESGTVQIKKFIKKKRRSVSDIQVIYLDQDNLESVANNIACHLSDHEITKIAEIFPISKYIVENNLIYQPSFFNKKNFASFSKHNSSLICAIVAESVKKIPQIEASNVIFVVTQKYLDTEWPYNPSFADFLDFALNNSDISYSPIAVDLQSKTITNL